MTWPVVIALAGVPRGKGRARATIRGGHAAAYTPGSTRKYEDQLRHVAREAMKGAEPTTLPVYVKIVADIQMPKLSKKREQMALDGELRPTTRPDLDNYVKLFDALNGIVFRDDNQIVDLYASKRYSRTPGLTITVAPLELPLTGGDAER